MDSEQGGLASGQPGNKPILTDSCFDCCIFASFAVSMIAVMVRVTQCFVDITPIACSNLGARSGLIRQGKDDESMDAR